MITFNIGDKVQSIPDPSRIGIIERIGPIHAGLQYYHVFWGGAIGIKTVPAVDLQCYTPAETPFENLLNGNLAGYQEFQRLITYLRLERNFPLRNNIYAFNASRTRFYPYQFKPLIKLLESQNQRLLICDEVGLGKTIEAGLILMELRARQTVKRVLIVCPANLTLKWKLEMRRRFGEDFKILRVADFIEYLNEYQEELDKTKINGIISIESIRNSKVLDLLDSIMPNFDLVIVDEAHHMRNFGRKQRKAALLLSHSATAMVMLTATPIQLGSENLFSLLNILDSEDFPDLWTADLRFSQNEPIVKAQICVAHLPPNLNDAYELLSQATDSPWIKKNPLHQEVLEGIASLSKERFDLMKHKRHLTVLQKGLSELNLIGHIFTRTRKREVHENTVQRRAYAIELNLSPIEKQFYDTVTDFVRAQSVMSGHIPLITQWRINMPQRRMASSIPAMVQFYRQNLGFESTDIPEDFDDSLIDEEDEGSEPVFGKAREKLQAIIRKWPVKGPDSKYEVLLEMLQKLRKEGPLKLIIFAFFKDTLNYLSKRLKHDGFENFIISGDVSAKNRMGIIEKFETDLKIEILLSSRVGSEGLDFQFCNALVNYDLPWNPMDVEQRIGRLDRIGQESPAIQIYNLWIKNTIEERILRRLYDRIHIFERSIGAMEVIIGDIVQQMERESFRKSLSPEEQKKLADQAVLVIENKMHEIERLESDAAQFIGTDAYFIEEVNSIKYRKKYVTGEQLRRFIVDFLLHNAPRTRLEYDHNTLTGKLYPDERLKDFISSHGKIEELGHLLSSYRNGIEITFDSQVAFKYPKIEFINVLHPIVTAIVDKYNEASDKHTNAQHVLLFTKLLPKGIYFYLVFRLRIHAAKERNTLECILLNDQLEEACDIDTADAVFGEMVEQGEDPSSLSPEIDYQVAEKACMRARELFHNYIKELRADIERKNDTFVDRRLASLVASYGKNINKQKDLLERAIGNGRQERYIRMLKGTIARLERELKERSDNLEEKRIVGVEYDEVATGILEVA
ncbi:MAG: DEAD/DEAH box helicase family protein [Nitrospirae bacterium]|nr:DEAD/DEAH box helicase family protein [Nitrospirota bacterium]